MQIEYGPADATATHCLFSSKIQIGFTFLAPAHPGSPGHRVVKRVLFSASWTPLGPCSSRTSKSSLHGSAEFVKLRAAEISPGRAARFDAPRSGRPAGR